MLKLILMVLLFYFLLVIFVYLVQSKMLFFPGDEPFDDCSEINLLGAAAKKEDFKGEQIRYYELLNKSAKAWIIHFHGNAGNACDRASYMQELSDIPINFLLAEYPGYAKSDVPPSQKTILKNALALIEFIESTDSKQLPIILYGESLGTGAATYLAAKSSENQSISRVKALILHTPYTSIGDLGQHHYPFLPVKQLIKNNFPAHDWALKVACPTLIIHGDKDRTIPITNAKKQAENFPTAPAFKEFADRYHNDLNFENSEYWETVKEFIKKSISL